MGVCRDPLGHLLLVPGGPFAEPDVGLHGRDEHEAVVRIEGRSGELHLLMNTFPIKFDLAYASRYYTENTHHWGKYHRTGGLQFNKIGRPP